MKKKVEGFAGEGLKGALQFLFIMATILMALVTCAYTAHADYQQSETVADQDYIVDGELDELGLDLWLEGQIADFLETHYHVGDLYFNFIQIPGGTLVILACKCKSQEAHNDESNNLQKVPTKSRLPKTNSS